jgi:hypothetical protein
VQIDDPKQWHTGTFLKFPLTEPSKKPPQVSIFRRLHTTTTYDALMEQIEMNPILIHLRAQHEVYQLLRVCGKLHKHFHLYLMDRIKVVKI